MEARTLRKISDYRVQQQQATMNLKKQLYKPEQKQITQPKKPKSSHPQTHPPPPKQPFTIAP